MKLNWETSSVNKQIPYFIFFPFQSRVPDKFYNIFASSHDELSHYQKERILYCWIMLCGVNHCKTCELIKTNRYKNLKDNLVPCFQSHAVRNLGNLILSFILRAANFQASCCWTDLTTMWLLHLWMKWTYLLLQN